MWSWLNRNVTTINVTLQFFKNFFKPKFSTVQSKTPRNISKNFIKFNKTTIQIKKKGKNKTHIKVKFSQICKTVQMQCDQAKYSMHNQIQKIYPIIPNDCNQAKYCVNIVII